MDRSWHPSSLPRHRGRRRRLAALLVSCLAASGTRLCADEIAFLPDWTAVEAEFFPLAPAATAQPVLTAAMVTDATAAFVADPFLIHSEQLWYMFFEVTVPLGKIALATSLDGLQWKYQHIVLAEPYQLSYPSVFEADGTFYMTPESTARHSVRLYRAQPFPDSWTYVTDLVSGRDFADPQVFRYDGRWWMFVGNGPSDTCYLYSSDSLEQGWSEHPQSPIVAGNRARARPGGRAVVLSGNRLFRLAQNSTPTYGRALRAFQVDTLTPTTYQEHEIPESPILQASGAGWNADGMHQCDPWWIGDRWLAAVDGANQGNWSIGIYLSPAVTTGADPQPLQGVESAWVRCAPNPFGTTTLIRWQMSRQDATAPARLLILDATGRRVLTRALEPSAAGGFAWDGSDAHGRRLPAGVYFCRLHAGDRLTTTRAVIAR